MHTSRRAGGASNQRNAGSITTPSLHPVSGTSSLLRVVPPLVSASVLSPSWFFHLWLLRSHRSPRFPRSTQSPLAQAQATLMPDAASVRKTGTAEARPALTTPPRFRHHPYAFDMSSVVPLRSSSCQSPDLVLSRPFPSVLTT